MLSAPTHRKLWIAGRIKRDEWSDRVSAEMHLEDAAWAD
jgi:single-stranded-DNA-specific exonuclease